MARHTWHDMITTTTLAKWSIHRTTYMARHGYDNNIDKMVNSSHDIPSHGNFFPSKLRTQVIPPSKLSLLDAVTCTNLLDRATCWLIYLTELPDKFEKLLGGKHQVTLSGNLLHSWSWQQTFIYLRHVPQLKQLPENEPLIYLRLVTATLHQVNAAGNSIK